MLGKRNILQLCKIWQERLLFHIQIQEISLWNFLFHVDQLQLLLFFLFHLLFLNLFVFLVRSCFIVIHYLFFSYRCLLFVIVLCDQLHQLYPAMILDGFYLLYRHLGPHMFHHVCALVNVFPNRFESSILIKLRAEIDQTKLVCSKLNNCSSQIYIWHTTILSMTTDHLILIRYLLLRILVLLQKSEHPIWFTN